MTATPGPADIPDDPGPPVPRWVGPMFVLLAAVTLPWIVVLWFQLPNRDVAAHYRLAWVGFDLLLAVTLARTGWVAWRGRDHVELPAVSAATLLVVDAWFDVVTAGTRADVGVAVALAVLVELPLAAMCVWIAANAEMVRRRRLHWALHVDPSRLHR